MTEMMQLKISYRDYIIISAALREMAATSSQYDEVLQKFEDLVSEVADNDWVRFDRIDANEKYEVYVRADWGQSTRKIQAIKELRTMSALGLKEAKDAVDRATSEWMKCADVTGLYLLTQANSLLKGQSVTGGQVTNYTTSDGQFIRVDIYEMVCAVLTDPEIVRLYVEDGKTFREIAAIDGRHATTLARAMRKYNIARHTSVNLNKRYKSDPATTEHWRAVILQTMSDVQAANERYDEAIIEARRAGVTWDSLHQITGRAASKLIDKYKDRI